MAPAKLHGGVTRNFIVLICRVSQKTYLEFPAQDVSTTFRKLKKKYNFVRCKIDLIQKE
jgi:hypothetical protein